MNDVKRYETWETGNKQVVTVAADHPLSLIIEALQAENERLKSISQSYEIRLDEMNNDCLTAELEVKQLSELVLINGKVEHNGDKLNKLKADAVRGMVLDFAINGLPHENWSKSAEEYANKLEAGELRYIST